MFALPPISGCHCSRSGCMRGMEKDRNGDCNVRPLWPPLSRLDSLLARPLLIAMCDRRKALLSAAYPCASSPRAASPLSPNICRTLARLRLGCAVLRQDLASFLAPGPAWSADEFKFVLMFSLTGLAFSLFLAAKAYAAGAADILAGILMLSS
jgi:hypothetical protein